MKIGTIYSSAAQNIQLAATAGKNQPAQFFATNDQLYNYVRNSSLLLSTAVNEFLGSMGGMAKK